MGEKIMSRPWNKGLKTGPLSDETKAKIAQAHLGKKHSKERRIKHSNTLKSKILKGEPVGRPSAKDGGHYKKNGKYKACPVCMKNEVYYTPKELKDNKRKCCSRKCLYNDKVYLDKLKNVDKGYMQTEEYKDTQRNPNLPEYDKYVNKVRKLTEQTYVEFKDEINPQDYPRTLCGVSGGYQLDHIISVKECWNRNISAENAAAKDNLQMVTWESNLEKRCSKAPKEK
jgi:hypothetical protein